MGWPVMHSRSPLLHGLLLRQHNLDGAYVPLAIKPEGLGAALRALAPLGFRGRNLTIPHKERAMTIVDGIDEVAKRWARSVASWSRRTARSPPTTMTITASFRDMLRADPELKADAGPIVVMGAGGGARAVVYGLIEHGAREIRLVNRTQERAETAHARFRRAN